MVARNLYLEHKVEQAFNKIKHRTMRNYQMLNTYETNFIHFKTNKPHGSLNNITISKESFGFK